MTQTLPTSSTSENRNQGELFAFLLRLHPLEEATLSPGAGNQIQAAFLDMVRQGDPSLAQWLHQPNQRRPYTVGLLQGFNHLSTAQLAQTRAHQQTVRVQPGQVYWLRITMLDTAVFSTFARCLITRPRSLTLRIGDASFEISRLLNTPESGQAGLPWVGYTSFAHLCTRQMAHPRYHIEFASPTAFSLGQKSWGKQLKLFPEPALVFESLARNWELFAPTGLRLDTDHLTPQMIASWCDESLSISHYHLETQHLSSSKFGHTGFHGYVTFEVKGNPATAEARWLTPLVRFAFYSGVGYKTTMGMGQTRCLNEAELLAAGESK